MPTTLELLGLPADARALLVCCDDLGIHPGATEGILAALDTGVATSCSLMVPPLASIAAMATLTMRPEIDFGVHLTMVSDFALQPFEPVAEPATVPSLLDAHGHFVGQADIAHLLECARIDDVRREISAQLAAVLSRGLRPTHLDWHCLADGGRPDILDATLELADEHGLAVRVWHTPARDEARAAGRPVVDHPFVDSFALGPSTKAATLRQALHTLPPGLTEWAVHPSVDSSEVRRLDPGWSVRTSDLAFLIDPETRRAVVEAGVTLVDYRQLQQARRQP